jgi:hypothetical protein
MWQGGESSAGIELFTSQPWRNRLLISTLLVLVDLGALETALRSEFRL